MAFSKAISPWSHRVCANHAMRKSLLCHGGHEDSKSYQCAHDYDVITCVQSD